MQRNLLEEELQKKQILMPADAREMLRKEKKNEEKFLPLTYRQVKHIVNSFKNENGIQDITVYIRSQVRDPQKSSKNGSN